MSVNHSPSTAEALLRRLEWTVLRRLDGCLQGDWRSLWRGMGLDLADLREYQHMDDVRHIDWNVTARMGTPHVRLFNEERDLTAWFVVDLSASHQFGGHGSRHPTNNKRELAIEFVALMARLMTRHGNRVGAVLCRHQMDRVLPARHGRLHVLNMIQSMRNLQPLSKARPFEGSTQLGDLLDAAGGQMRRRSSVFVVSDFISEPGWEAPLGRLSLRHDVSAIRLFDPLEMELPALGLVTLQDAETGEQIAVDTHDNTFRQRYAAEAQRRETALRASLARAGVDTLELTTAEPLLGALLRFIALRQRRAQAFRMGTVRGVTETPAVPMDNQPS